MTTSARQDQSERRIVVGAAHALRRGANAADVLAFLKAWAAWLPVDERQG